MKGIILLITIIVAIFSVVSAQKLTEPKLLGNWIAGEDPSEFLLHSVMEYSQTLLEKNPEGKLIVRICSADEFSTAFIKAPLNPLAASQYNQYRLLVPYEKIFIANSSKCLEDRKFVFNEYWFVPAGNTLEYEEIFLVNSINHKNFVVDGYNFTNNKLKEKSMEVMNKEFEENIVEFVLELKNNPKTEGFIVHNSKNKRMRRNIEKVNAILKKENISFQRVKTITKVRLYFDRNEKLKPIKDEKTYFPILEAITIKK
ncbi:MAG: hypothetical protein LC768_11110 [Acidobacteria bacterium]|nr:hypothetical protein [Acidobacteriota bacterium]MCA1638862.1 hypothetical protein [Acidobacteriota bacterium]